MNLFLTCNCNLLASTAALIYTSPRMASKGGSARSSTKKTTPAKSALLGTRSDAAETSAMATLPKRAPFGQEVDDEDNDDDEMMQQGLDTEMQEGDDDEVMIGDGITLAPSKAAQTNTSEDDSNLMSIDPSLKPNFKPLSKGQAQSARDALDVTRGQLRKVPIPPHRMTPLKNEWPKIYTPLVEMAGLQVRMNVKRKTVEIKVSESIL